VPIKRLELVDFRNYDTFTVEPGERLTVLTGPNGAGKTSVIEALQVLTATVSFRTAHWADLVRWGSGMARVALSAEDEGRPLEMTLDITALGKRAYRVNGRNRRRVADVAGIIPSVTFTPADLELVKGASEARRAALDDLGGQLSATYTAVRREYGRVVRHRNVLLRGQVAEAEEIAPWDEQLAALGARLIVHRVRLFERLRREAVEIHAGLSDGEVLEMEYLDRSGVGVGGAEEGATVERVADAMRAAIERRRSEERARQSTIVGPHRDDMGFTIGGREARAFASQGQQRTIALAWKLAEVRVIEDVKGRGPVLLLDDVMSELDETRRQALLSTTHRAVQTFVTSTSLTHFSEEVANGASVVNLG
jgi:DNA replication and repair protein RecF